MSKKSKGGRVIYFRCISFITFMWVSACVRSFFLDNELSVRYVQELSLHDKDSYYENDSALVWSELCFLSFFFHLVKKNVPIKCALFVIQWNPSFNKINK